MTFGDFDNLVVEEPVEEVKEKKKNYLFDFLNNIQNFKNDIFDETTQSDYKPYVINRFLSANMDTVLYAQEMNQRSDLPKKLQHDFYLYGLRKKKRYCPWQKQSKDDDVDAIMEYYNYSRTKALQILKLHTSEDLEYIKEMVSTGGKKK